MSGGQGRWDTEPDRRRRPRPPRQGGARDADPAVRDAFAREVLESLAAQCAGSRAVLRGSLAAGTADAWSDVDVEWAVPAQRFAACVDGVRPVLERVRPLVSLRTDPDSAGAPGERLLFAAVAGLPLFWRLDLAIRAMPSTGVPTVPAPPAPWSPAASALANAVATVKSVLRGDPVTARDLLDRGFTRVRGGAARTGDWTADITSLAAAASADDPSLRPMAAAVVGLAVSHLGPA